jgi:hypothetical protein
LEEIYEFNAADWAQKTFGAVVLGDKRRTKRAVALATALAQNPGGSLPLQTGSFGQLKAAYRLLNEADVTHAALLEPHYKQTQKQAGKLPVVLMVQDTTELDYTFHRATTELGPIGNGGGRGEDFYFKTSWPLILITVKC